MRIKRLFATMAVGATVTSGLVLGVAPASADPSNPFHLTPHALWRPHRSGSLLRM